MSAILVADCVGKRYGDRRVLTAGTLRAVAGEVRALLGRNGAGKSTLLKIAAGWIAPDSGTVRWEGEVDLRASLPRLAARGLFYLPDHDLLSRAFTLRAQLELLRRRFGGGDPVAAAERMGVAQVLDRKPGSFSGGETRRAELAAALVRRPRCLLADEPLRGIAPRDAELLLATLRDLARDGCAVIVTGHEVRTILPAADHVTWCIAGTTHELGPPAQAMRDDAFRKEYLGESVAGASHWGRNSGEQPSPRM